MSDIPNNSATSLTLLGRLKAQPDDPDTWDEFVARYGPKIRKWCLQWGLQAADADDVTQNVLLALSKQMRTFEYRASGRFRSWLKTIARRAWIDCLEMRKREVVATGDDRIRTMLSSVAAQEEFLKQLEEECDRNIFDDALIIVEHRVQPKTWQAFQLTAIESRSGKEVAETLQMSVLAVYRARSRVQSMLQEEVQKLDCNEPLRRK